MCICFKILLLLCFMHLLFCFAVFFVAAAATSPLILDHEALLFKCVEINKPTVICI